MTKITRRFNSFGFLVRKAYRSIATAKPSIFIVAAIIAAASIFLLGGGIYDILEKPLFALPLGRNILYFYPSTQEQFVLESFSVMISYSFGLLGLLLMYQSTKYAYRPRQAFILLLAGALFLLMAYFNIENLLWDKMRPR